MTLNKILEEELINERIEDQYVHNTNIKRLISILNDGYLSGSVQHDGSSKNAGEKPELCVSRSDMIPQNTGTILSSKISLGNLIKIQLKINNITNGKLGLKKPYPVSYGNFQFNRILEGSIWKLKEKIKDGDDKEKVYKIWAYFLARSNYERLNNRYPEEFKGSRGKKYNLTKNELFSLLDSINKNASINREVKKVKNLFNFLEKHNPEQTGEERLDMSHKKIPVSSKYMTINIPEKLIKYSRELRKSMEKYSNDPELFKIYDDNSRRVLLRTIKNNLFKK